MRIAISVALLALSSNAASAATQAWEFAYVQRSTDLEVVQGQGNLKREGPRLVGNLTGSLDRVYQIDVKLSGNNASATFGATESDDGGTLMRGTYRQSQIPGNTGCWQTIQLSDAFSSLTLSRNIYRCEP